MVRGREKFKRARGLLHLLWKILSFFPFNMRMRFYEFSRMINGYKGFAIRYAIIKSIANNCGENVVIYPGVYLLNPQNITIGNNVSIHPMCYIEALGEVVIGNDVSIAHGVSIMSTSHNYSNLSIPIKDQGGIFGKVVIGDNVWIGAKATILSNKTIESGAIIGANSVVTKNVKENSIVGGIPAKLIKERIK